MTQQHTNSPRALAGVRVLDFTTVMSGPFATRLLSDLGADVVKVETLEGDQVRARPPLRDGYSTYFAHLNAGKRSIALNLKSKTVLALVRRLIARFDVVVENFRPGVMARLGLGYEDLAQINPRLIFCSISGYGQAGPRAGAPAYAPVIHAASGFDMSTMSYQDDAPSPQTTGIFIADILGAAYAFGAIQTALYQREHTGVGQFIDVSMLESMLSMLIFETQQAQFPQDQRRPLYRPLRARDGFVMVAPTSPNNFAQLCVAVGHAEWQDDPRFLTNSDRNHHWSALLDLIEQWTISRDADAAISVLAAHGVPCSKYLTMAEVLEDPQLKSRGAFSQITDGAGTFNVSNPPFRLSGTQTQVRNSVSRLGEHGEEILRTELGMDDSAIEALRNEQALG